MVTEALKMTGAEVLHLKKVRAGELGGLARGRRLTPEQLSAIGKLGGRPRKPVYHEIKRQKRLNKKTQRRQQPKKELMACSTRALWQHWRKLRKEAETRGETKTPVGEAR